MAAFVRAFSRAFPTSLLAAQILKQFLLLGCAGLFVSVLLLTYGLDLGPGFF